MDNGAPQRTVAYNSHMTDASRWDRFTPRDGDIFISTPPKCGTTWTQAICALLIFGRPDTDVRPGVISPWLDAKIAPLDEMLAMLDAQTHRRFLKTHTPLDGTPYYPHCVYLTVYRDPRDAYFSMRNHAANQMSEVNIHRATKDVGAGFRAWVDTSYKPGDSDNFSLEALVHHYRTYRRHAGLPNLHMFHYADMSRDLKSVMARIAGNLGIAVAEPLLGELAAAAAFESMKKNASQFVPGAGQGRWKDESRFFNKGTSVQWRDRLSADDLAFYDAKIDDLLPENDIAWLQYGDNDK